MFSRVDIFEHVAVVAEAAVDAERVII